MSLRIKVFVRIYTKHIIHHVIRSKHMDKNIENCFCVGFASIQPCQAGPNPTATTSPNSRDGSPVSTVLLELVTWQTHQHVFYYLKYDSTCALSLYLCAITLLVRYHSTFHLSITLLVRYHLYAIIIINF